MPDAAECKTKGGGRSRAAKGESRGLSIKAGYRDRACRAEHPVAAGQTMETNVFRMSGPLIHHYGTEAEAQASVALAGLGQPRARMGAIPTDSEVTERFRGFQGPGCSSGRRQNRSRIRPVNGATPHTSTMSGVRTRSFQPSLVDHSGRWRGRGRGGDTSTHS